MSWGRRSSISRTPKYLSDRYSAATPHQHILLTQLLGADLIGLEEKLPSLSSFSNWIRILLQPLERLSGFLIRPQVRSRTLYLSSLVTISGWARVTWRGFITGPRLVWTLQAPSPYRSRTGKPCERLLRKQRPPRLLLGSLRLQLGKS